MNDTQHEVSTHEQEHEHGAQVKPLFQYMLNRRIKLNQSQASSSRDLSAQVSQRGQPTASTTANASKDLSGKEQQSGTLALYQGEGMASHRSPWRSQSTALLRRTRDVSRRVERLCKVGRLQSLRTEAVLCPERGLLRQHQQGGGSEGDHHGLEPPRAGCQSSALHSADGEAGNGDLQGPIQAGSPGKASLHAAAAGDPEHGQVQDHDQASFGKPCNELYNKSQCGGDLEAHVLGGDPTPPGNGCSEESRSGEGGGRSRCGVGSTTGPTRDKLDRATLQIEGNTKMVDFSEERDVIEMSLVDSSPGSENDLQPDGLQDYSAIEMMHYQAYTSKKDGKAPKTKIQKPKKKNLTFKRSNTGKHRSSTEDWETDTFCSSTSTTSTLPWRIAKALMAMMTMMIATAHSDLRDLIRGGQEDVWDMFCAPQSWLPSACQEQGLCCQRINLENNFDMYHRKEAYSALREKRGREKPKRMWVSARCTYWFGWTALNYNTEEKRAKLEAYRRKERAMFRQLVPFLEESVILDEPLELFWEWPTRCAGCEEPMFLRLQAFLQRLGKPLYFCRVDGCRYGLRSLSGGFLKKSWTIATASESFYNIYKTKVCVGSHEHDHIQGLETSRSTYYPWRMVVSFAQTWRSELYPDKRLHALHAPAANMLSTVEMHEQLELFAGDEIVVYDEEREGDVVPAVEPTAAEKRKWEAQLQKYHREAGHPNNFNLGRILKDAGMSKWKIETALQLKCGDCSALKLGGISSGKIPPASLRPLPRAWEVVGLDCSEWMPPGLADKYKILVRMDLATEFKNTVVLMKYGSKEMKTESQDQILDAFCKHWLATKPKPQVLIPDNAKTIVGEKFRMIFSDLNIHLDPPAVKESWAHGLMERAVQETKN